MTNTRNTYIDSLRGCASLGIIAIHTAFWSGTSYTPVWFRSLTLLLDVPFFFFISGWAASYNEGNIIKTCKSIAGIWLKWIYFISVMALLCMLPVSLFSLGGIVDFKDLIQNYMFHVSFPCLPVIGGSIWFMPHYFTVVFTNQCILNLMSNSQNYQSCKRLYCIILFVLFLWNIYGHDFFGVNQYFLFYSFFWNIGIQCNDVKKYSGKNLFITSIGLLLIWGISGYLFDIPVTDLQSAKFPPHLMYLAASLLCIIIVLYIKNTKLKKENVYLIHIGQNAIFYFFAQGVGSSLIYTCVSKFQIDNWLLKWLAVFLCNLVITCILAEILRITYHFFISVIKKSLTQLIHCQN